MRRLALVLALVAGACVDGPGDDTELREADFELFVDLVQPVLAERCGLAACHGNERRPLEVFADGGHRAEGTSAATPLTDAELRANFLRARAMLIDVEVASESPLLAKPLAVAAGGTRHANGPVFDSRDDYEYLALLEWAEATLGGEAP